MFKSVRKMKCVSNKSIVVPAAIFSFLLFVLLVMYVTFPSDNKVSNIPNHYELIRRGSDNQTTFFPTMVHHTWKTGSAPPVETTRWRDSCKRLNPDHKFQMYDDDDLAKFAEKYYPEYFPLFKTLKGVYMADMARLLVTYHYGGTYLDLDFYCFRPFRCLEEYALRQAEETLQAQNPPLHIGQLNDLLVVSREPEMHAQLFRNKSRVVIQDFFLATPRHPFIKWMLDDQMAVFEANPLHPVKGPFSYSIEKHIDAYYKAMGIKPAAESSRTQLRPHNRTLTAAVSSNITSGGVNVNVSRNISTHAVKNIAPTPSKTTAKATPPTARSNRTSLIVELREDVLHSLVDATNSRLYSVCKQSPLPESMRETCEAVAKKQFFNPTDDTILVHMWTHTYLGWSAIRGAYNSGSYRAVEKMLKPTYNCPNYR